LSGDEYALGCNRASIELFFEFIYPGSGTTPHNKTFFLIVSYWLL
jgi:hypothetical protein